MMKTTGWFIQNMRLERKLCKFTSGAKNNSWYNIEKIPVGVIELHESYLLSHLNHWLIYS